MKRTKQAKERCRKIISDYFNNAEWLYSEFVHTDNPDHLSHLEYMLFHFFELFYHNSELKDGKIMRLAPAFCKLAFQECKFQQNNTDFDKLNILTSVLGVLHQKDKRGDIDLSSIDVNGTFEYFKEHYQKDEKEKTNATEIDCIFVKKEDYKVFGPLTFEEAEKIGKYSCPDSQLCYTKDKSTWDNYTLNNTRTVYCILKDNYELTPPVHDDNDKQSPYDNYGLSMVFVFVDPFGKMPICNTRWNHHANYAPGISFDMALSESQIEWLYGLDFKETFKPKRNISQELIDKAREIIWLSVKDCTIITYSKVQFFGPNIIISFKYDIGNRESFVFFKNGKIDEYRLYNKFSIKGCIAHILDEEGNFNILNKDGDTYFDSISGFNWYAHGVSFVENSKNTCYFVKFDNGEIIYNIKKHENKEIVKTLCDSNGKLYLVLRRWNYDENCNEISEYTLIDEDQNVLIDDVSGIHLIGVTTHVLVYNRKGEINIYNLNTHEYTLDEWLNNAIWSASDVFSSDTCLKIMKEDKSLNIFVPRFNRFMLKEWYRHCSVPHGYLIDGENYFISIIKNEDGKYNYADIKQGLISDVWFDKAFSIAERDYINHVHETPMALFGDDFYTIVSYKKEGGEYKLRMEKINSLKDIFETGCWIQA